MALSLMSPVFANGGNIPERYTRRGKNLLPPLHWRDVPAGARSLALVVEDPDAPRGTFEHCAIYDMPAGWDHLPEGAQPIPGSEIRYGRNDFGNDRYDGPEPPPGHGAHHYHFRLAALDVPELNLPTQPQAREVLDEVRAHVIEEADLVGLFER